MSVVVIIIQCTALKLFPWELIQLGKGIRQGLLRFVKDGNEHGRHSVWHSLCNLCVPLWLLPCNKDLCLGFSPRLAAVACSGTDSGM